MSILSVVLVRPKSPGNVGATARICANFAVKELRIVDAQCRWNGTEARERATGWSKQYLDRAMVYLDVQSAIARSTTAVAFALTSKRSYSAPLTWSELPAWRETQDEIALVFGNEREGLNNEEIEACPFHCEISTHPDFPAMNLSHSVAVTLSHLFSGANESTSPKKPDHPTLGQAHRIENQFKELLLQAGLDQGGNPDRILKQIRPLLHRAKPTADEATMAEFVMGRIRTFLKR